MFKLMRFRRAAALLLVLLSLVTSGMAVICDEGQGRQLMEFLPDECCVAVAHGGANADGTRGTDSLNPDECGACRDARALLLLQRDDERGAMFASATRVQSPIPTSAQALPPSPVPTPRASLRCPGDPCSAPVEHFSRTVVRLC